MKTTTPRRAIQALVTTALLTVTGVTVIAVSGSTHSPCAPHAAVCSVRADGGTANG